MRPTFSFQPDSANTPSPIELLAQEVYSGDLISGSRDAQGILLLNEMSHRFKNELTSLIGVVSAASMRSKNPEACRVLNEVLEKLHDHATVSRALQMPCESGLSDASSYLRNLLAAMSRARLKRRGIRVVYRESQPIPCSAVQCWTLGMIVSELITNCIRHAFGEGDGLIEIDLVGDDDWIECRVSDNGSCAVPIREGNGLRIVQSLARSLGGAIHQHFGRRGMSSVVFFPRVQ